MTFIRFKPPSRISADLPVMSRPRVLYVEDEDVNWEIAQHNLEERFEMSRAESARDTFRLIAANTYHLILLDIQLSGSDIDGLAVARLLKGCYGGEGPSYATGVRPVTTPIIFVTAYTARYTHDELIAAGGEDMIAKPVDFTRLSLAIARVWGRGQTLNR